MKKSKLLAGLISAAILLLTATSSITGPGTTAPPEPRFTLTFDLAKAGIIYSTQGSDWGDFDKDGYIDLAIQGANEYVKICRNQGDGTFVEHVAFKQGSTGGYYGIDWGDCDNDGDLDLAVGSFYPGQNYLYINNGDGTFKQIPQFEASGTMDVEWADYDKDGDLDLAVANNDTLNYLYHNNGDGTFTKKVGLGMYGKNLDWGDYDNDGDLDLMVAERGGLFLCKNNAGSSFTRTSLPANPQPGRIIPHDIDGADYDGDGDLDLAVGNRAPYDPIDAQNYLYINNGNGTFTISPQFGTGALSLAWGDFNNDGHPDLAVGGEYPKESSLYINNGDGTFTRSVQFGQWTWNIAWGDIDNDGDLDIVSGHNIYTNITPLNRPPTAVCKDITVSVDNKCEAHIVPGDVDAGSHDPDGDKLTLSLDNPGPFPPGQHKLTLTAADEKGESDTCQALVTVVDKTPPVITLSDPTCVTVKIEKEKGKKKEKEITANLFTITASDNCPGELSITVDKVEIYNDIGDLVQGQKLYEVSDNNIHVYRSAAGWSIVVTVTAGDRSGNSETKEIRKPLKKCRK